MNSATINYNRILNDGEPLDFSPDLELMVSERMLKMTEFSKYAYNNQFKIDWLLQIFQDDYKLVYTAMDVLGISLEQLRSFFKDVELSKLGRSMGKVKALTFYDSWRNQSFSFKNMCGYQLVGLADLLLTGKEKLSSVSRRHPFLNECYLLKITEYYSCPESQRRSLALASLKGRYASEKGLHLQKMLADVFDDLRVPCLQEQKIVKTGKKWDLLVNNKVAVEVSDYNTTASGQSGKRQAMMKDVEACKGNGLKFVSVIGGAGWLRRVDDLKSICDFCDECFGFSEDGLFDFFSYVVRDVLQKRISKDRILKTLKKRCEIAKRNA